MKVEEILKTKNPLPVEKKLAINLVLSTNRATSLMAESLKPFDISIPQFNVLRILRGQQGKPANLSTIQDRMVNQMSNTSRLIDKLLEKELVERTICEENRRKIEVFITATGMELLKKIDPVIADSEHRISQNLTKMEIEKLNHLLEKLRA
ncbi:MarR family transcriptional regulator [Antarcticibacterium arcticum]|uniref:MarR family transcriptional regulator n=1 Tax=Antarcticibacterium arcticum TaxID=2585771 RepID=A0A5B8YI86_9FLAO|nr:MarR family transcriptional regulator [Antarcticibacterium arcticum]QED36313.1 MarR family transcriptional regulator [Antarcticibacterium arcticum]